MTNMLVIDLAVALVDLVDAIFTILGRACVPPKYYD